MYKKNKKQLAYQALKFVVVTTCLIAIHVSIDKIVEFYIEFTGINSIETLSTVLARAITAVIRILSVTGIIVYGAFTATEIYTYLIMGREFGSITKEEELESKIKLGTKTSMNKACNKNMYTNKPEISLGIREIKEDIDIERHLNKNKGR